MKRENFRIAAILALSFIGLATDAQMYYTGNSAEAIESNGKVWIEKKLPPSVIVFSDRSGEAEVKEDLSSLIETKPVAVTQLQPQINDFADFRMKLDKQQIATQLYTGKVYTSTGFLKINNVIKTVPVQYLLDFLGDIENGFTISMIIRFTPTDFGIKVTGDTDNAPVILKINGGMVDEI